jgi:hypothetical protein
MKLDWRVRPLGLILLAAFVVAAFTYLLVLTPYIGGGYDDACYVALAKALAQGKGYGQVFMTGNPPEPQYPPGWPLLLSAVWLILPDFPANAIAFKVVSVICALALVGITYRWMRWRGESSTLSALVAILTLSNPLIFGTASTAFSEMGFTFFVLLALWLIDRYSRKEQARWFDAILPSLAAAFAMYVRMFGVAVIVAAACYLLLQPNRRKGLAFVGFSLLWVAPWLFRGALLPTNVWGYSQQFLLKSMEQPELGVVSWGDLIVRVILNLRAYLLAGLPGAVLPSQVPLTFVNLDSGLRLGSPFSGSDIILALLVAAALVGQVLMRRDMVDWFVACYLGLALLWPWEPTRFVVPLISLLYYYLLKEIATFASPALRQISWARMLRTLALGAVVVSAFANFALQAQVAYDIRRSVGPPAEWAARFRLYDWIKQNTDKESVLASLNNTELYLYTGRAVVRSLGSREAIDKFGVNYMVLIPYGGVMVTGDLARMEFGPLYQSNSTAFDRVYHDDAAGIEVFRVQ